MNPFINPSIHLLDLILNFVLFCRRVMLKISGEALQGNTGFGVDPAVGTSYSRPPTHPLRVLLCKTLCHSDAKFKRYGYI